LIVPTTNQSPSFLRSGGRLSNTQKADLKRRFNRYVQYFWNVTCTHTLPYKIVYYCAKGRGIECTRSGPHTFAEIQQTLVLFNEYVGDTMMTALKDANYSSLIYHSEAHDCITYGPLQYANHECYSHYKFSQNAHILTSIVLHGRTEEYDGFKIKQNHLISPAIGSEIVVDYGQQFFAQSTVSCICNKTDFMYV
jgi:hypothetical protein